MTKTKVSKRSPKNGTAVVKVKAALPVKAAEGVRAITAVDPQALLAQAIDKGMPVESMERLLAMRREMKAEYAREQYFKALAGFQNACPVIAKAKKVPNKDGTKKYSYAPIEDIVSGVKDLLMEWGFSFTFKSKQVDGMYTSICFAHHQDGHEEQTEFTVPTTFPEYMNMSGAQMQGAACTYADRYAFKNAFGIVTKGDDTDAVRPESDGKRTPIRPPQELSLKKGFGILGGKEKESAVPVAHEVKKEPEKLSDYDKILKYTKATVYEPKTKKTIAVFTENEQIDYTHEANEAKDNPEELKRIGAEMVETWKKRERAIKGETA